MKNKLAIILIVVQIIYVLFTQNLIRNQDKLIDQQSFNLSNVLYYCFATMDQIRDDKHK